MDKKLSIIVPVYNAEQFIDRCIKSLVNQTYKNLEILLINDGSRDNSLMICKNFAKLDDRIKVFDKPNGGAASARNLGLKNATGEYIAFCDADDYHDYNSFETLINIMEEQDLPTIECLAKVRDDSLCVVENSSESKELEIKSSEQAIRDIFLRKGNVHLATRVTRAEYLVDLIIPEGKRVEDFYFTICLLTRTNGTAIYQYPFYNYILSNGSVTRSQGGSIYLDAIYFYEHACAFLEKLNYNLQDAQSYYLLKIYYLLAISLTNKERKQFKDNVRTYKKDLRLRKKAIKQDLFLSKKEKFVLRIAMQSFRLARMMYLIKNRRR